MAKTINEEKSSVNFNVEIEDEKPQYIPVSEFVEQNEKETYNNFRKHSNSEGLISCLRNEKIIVKYANRPNTNIVDTKHELYGGMANSASRTFCVNMLRNGSLANVLNDGEKAFLEYYMGLEPNALSIYLKKDNYWKNYQVRLIKSDTILNLAIPEDYIKYKVLLTNVDIICPSLKQFTEARKATYQFYMVNDGDETKQTNNNMSSKMEAMFELGKIQDNKSVLKVVVEIMDGRPIARTSKLEFIQAQAFKTIDANPKLFISIIKDQLLKTKVLIAECLEYGLVISKSGLYYTASGEPLCEAGEDSTLSNSARYLSSPKRQEAKLTLEAKLKLKKD